MTQYQSGKTENGNVGFSMISAEEAEQQARKMDEKGCYNCYNCDQCSYCKYCDNCEDCSPVPRWDKTAGNNLKTINGLLWPVTFSLSQMQIGCQSHTIEEWRNFTKIKIENLHKNATEFWGNYKELIFQFIELEFTQRSKPNNQTQEQP